MPEWSLHRGVERIIQQAAVEHGDKLKCAIICSSGVYGQGRGLVRTHSLFMPDFFSEITKLGAAFYTQSGGNSRGWVHLDDLMQIYLKLIEAAAQGGGKASWGLEVRVPTFHGDCDVIEPNQLTQTKGLLLHRLP